MVYARAFSLYYQGLGLSGREIGSFLGIIPLVTMFGASIWGMASDASGKRRLLFLLSLAGVWFAVVLITRALIFLQLISSVILYALFFAPIIPMTDNSVMVMLGDQSMDVDNRQGFQN